MRHLSIFLRRLIVVMLAISPAVVSALDGSGACSYHGGVNCSRGMQPNGTVYCNDGWTESTVAYVFTRMCQHSGMNPDDMIYANYVRQQRTIAPVAVDALTNKDYSWCMGNMYQTARYIERMNGCINYQTAQTRARANSPTCPEHASLKRNYSHDTAYCVCDDGFYNYDRGSSGQQGYCQQGDPPKQIDEYVLRQMVNSDISSSRSSTQVAQTCSTGQVLRNNVCMAYESVCDADYGIHSTWSGTFSDFGSVVCGCEDGYQSYGATQTCSPIPARPGVVPPGSDASNVAEHVTDRAQDTESNRHSIWDWIRRFFGL